MQYVRQWIAGSACCIDMCPTETSFHRQQMFYKVYMCINPISALSYPFRRQNRCVTTIRTGYCQGWAEIVSVIWVSRTCVSWDNNLGVKFQRQVVQNVWRHGRSCKRMDEHKEGWGVISDYLGLWVKLLAESTDQNITLNMFINKAQRTPAWVRVKILFDHFYSSARVSSSWWRTWRTCHIFLCPCLSFHPTKQVLHISFTENLGTRISYHYLSFLFLLESGLAKLITTALFLSIFISISVLHFSEYMQGSL